MRLRPPGPPPSRNWYARRLTGASRGTPPPAQAPRVWPRRDKHLGALCSAIPGNAAMPLLLVGLARAKPLPSRRSTAQRVRPASTRRGAPAVVRGTARSAAQAAGVASQPSGGPSTPSARRHSARARARLTPKAARPPGTPFSGDARHRVARSRGAPQRGRCAGDFGTQVTPARR